ncbi:MAG: CsbD family protein [Pelovirga sp.]
MKSGNRDQLEGKLHEMRGKIREAVGEITHNRELMSAGKSEHISGQIQRNIGQINAMMLPGYK